RRDGGVRARHAFTLGFAVYIITFVSFVLVGERGIAIVTHEWLPLLIINVGGVAGFTRLFTDVAGAMAAEAGRRGAAGPAAITPLGRGGAHEIHNALMGVAGGASIPARRLPLDSEDSLWLTRARDRIESVKQIIIPMNAIPQIEKGPPQGL